MAFFVIEKKSTSNNWLFEFKKKEALPKTRKIDYQKFFFLKFKPFFVLKQFFLKNCTNFPCFNTNTPQKLWLIFLCNDSPKKTNARKSFSFFKMPVKKKLFLSKHSFLTNNHGQVCKSNIANIFCLF